MALENWFKANKLIKHETNKEELESIFGVIDRCFKDAGLKGLSSDQKYISSYQAAFEAAIALVYCNGYRPIKTGHHYIIWQCMKDLLKEGDEIYNEAKNFVTLVKEKVKDKVKVEEL